MGFFSAIAATASGLTAQRVRMDTVSGNVANMETTARPDGAGPYKRHIVRFSSGDSAMPMSSIASRLTGASKSGVVLTQVGLDEVTPTRKVYAPAHPDSAEDGFVEMPNVDLITEMTDLTSANRSYQANVTVLNAVKQMALRALDIGSR